MRSRLLATLSTLPIARISVDLGGGVWIAVAAELLIAVGRPVVIAAVSGLITALVAYCGIALFLLRLEEAITRGLSPLRRRALLIVCGTLIVFVV